MNKSKLKKEISKNLKKLDRLLEEIRNYEVNLDEDNWDYDYYSELLEKTDKLKSLLEEKDNGLLVQLEEYQTALEEEDDEE